MYSYKSRIRKNNVSVCTMYALQTNDLFSTFDGSNPFEKVRPPVTKWSNGQ